MERKYLEYFDGVFDSTVAEKMQPENWPYIGYSETDGFAFTVIAVPITSNGPWVTFTALEDNSSIGLEKLSTNQTLEYSTGTSIWNPFDITTNISLNNGDKVYIRGVLSDNNTDSNYTQFKMTGKIAASGNCTAIWNYQDLNASLKEYCGKSMFLNCTALTKAPDLQATTLAYACYAGMFFGCTSLTQPPTLSATTLAYSCCSNMFRDCTSLTQAPDLQATILTEYCYSCMFYGCTSLTHPPILPSTTLARSCYYYMFGECSGLTQAPELPATTLALYCYEGMFWGCTGLTQGPELPALTLTKWCYGYMFKGCSNLNYIKCLATDISAIDCTEDWVFPVSTTGTFVKHPSMNNWTTGVSGIPSGWTVVDADL